MRRAPLTAGVIGCGEIGSRYVPWLEGAGFRADTVFDERFEPAMAIGSKYGVRVARSLADIIDSPLDLVCICTPNTTHEALVCRALEAGRNVVVEHPMATHSAGAMRMIEQAARVGRQLFVVRQRRFAASVQMVLAVLGGGRLGRITDVSATVVWSRSPQYFQRSGRAEAGSGGVVMNQASHFLDLLVYLFGDPIDLQGVRGNLRHTLPVEDTVAGCMRFPDDIMVKLFFSVGAADAASYSALTIRGTRGVVRLGGKAWERVEQATHASPAIGADADGHRVFLDTVRRRLLDEPVETVDGQEGLRTVRLIERILGAFPMSTGEIQRQLADGELSAFFQTPLVN